MALNFPSSPTVGQVYTDSVSGFSYEWDGTVWKSYSASSSSNIKIIDDISGSFNGSTTTFPLRTNGISVTPASAQSLIINLGGVVQDPSDDYSISSSNIVFSTAPEAGLTFSGVSLGPAVPINTIPNGTVTDGSLTVSGILSASNSLYVNGDARVTGILTVGNSSLTLNGNTNTINGVSINSGFVTATGINASGIVTASAFYVGGTPFSSGIGIQSAGTTIGTGITTLNFVGAANTFSVSGSTATITITGNSAPVTKISNATFNPVAFSTATININTSTSVGYAITGLSPFQVITFDLASIGGTLTSPAVQCGAAGTVSGTISFTAAGVAYTSGASQTIKFISGGDIVTKNWDVIIEENPLDATTALGWDASADTYAYYTYGTSTQIIGLGATTRDYKNLDVQSRMRRCVINNSGVVQYYLDADDSTKRSGDWLRIVERQGINADYTGIHTEAAHPGLRMGVSNWSAGTYTLGQRVIHNNSLWECVVASTTATPAAGSVASDLSGTAGMVMVEIPAFSVRHTKSGNVHTFQVGLGTAVSGTGYEVHPAFIKSDGSYRSYIYMGAYQGTGGTTSGALSSVSGVSNVVNATRATFRTAASGRGTGWHQLSYYENAAAYLLMVTEFDSVNIQRRLGNGAQDGSVYVVNTGLSNGQGNKSQNNYTVGGANTNYISYRGLENIYGRAWQWADGFNAGTTSTYLNKNWTTWADDTSTNYTLVGTVASGSSSYQTDFLNISNVLLPSAASGGSATTFIADGLWTSTGWRVAFVSGNTDLGSLVGPFCLNLSGASSVAAATVGGRLSWAPV